ncbi:MAG TPA: hypothetical protein VFB78_15795 [Acidimicrobiales bacterium]|nr:hypothetical protein [Acidimicrobiales bacterium]
MHRRLALLVILTAAALGACGGGDSDDASSGSTTTSTAAGTTTSTASAAATTTSAAKKSSSSSASAVALDRLVLVAADFPDGWTASAPDPGNDADDAALAACAGSSPPSADVAELDGQDFGKDEDQISSDASVVKDDASYSKDMAAIRSSKFSTCLEDFLTKEIEKDAAGAETSIDVANLDIPKHGDFALGRRVSVELKANGQTLHLFADFVVYGKKRIELSASFLGFGRPVDTGLRNSLANKLGARLDAAPAP